MKKLLILAVIALFALSVVPAALAGNGGGGGTGPGDGTGTGVCPGTCPGPQAGGTQYAVNGTVTAIGADSLTITVKSGNRAMRTSVGKSIALKVTADTLLYERTIDRTLVTITLDDFAVGDRANSVGTIDLSDAANPVFTAYRVTLLPPVGSWPGCPN